MRLVLSLFIFLFILGCGGGGGDSEDNSEQNQEVNNNYLRNINDEYFSTQWYLQKDDRFYSRYNINENAHIHAGNYLRKYNGTGVKVGIIDDGLDIYHNDLRGNIAGGYNAEDETTNVSHNYGENHGTAVTGIIAAKANNIYTYGIAHGSKTYFIKHKKQDDSVYDTIKLFKISDNTGIDVINCSWGTGNVNEATKEYIQHLANHGRGGKGTIIVFASGNDNSDMGNDESAIPEVISVGATNAQNLRSEYSNYGKYLDIVAPGGYNAGVNAHGIATLTPNNGSDFFTGTSFSAPIVTGVIALMLEINPNLTRLQVENILKNTADKIGNYRYINGKNYYYGYGKVNLSRALEAVLN